MYTVAIPITMHVLHQLVFGVLVGTMAVVCISAGGASWMYDDKLVRKVSEPIEDAPVWEYAKYIDEDTHLTGSPSYICVVGPLTRLVDVGVDFDGCLDTVGFFRLIGYDGIGRALKISTYGLIAGSLMCIVMALSHENNKWRAIWSLATGVLLLLLGVAWIVGASYVNNDLFDDKKLDEILRVFGYKLVLQAKPTAVPIAITVLASLSVAAAAIVLYAEHYLRKGAALFGNIMEMDRLD